MPDSKQSSSVLLCTSNFNPIKKTTIKRTVSEIRENIWPWKRKKLIRFKKGAEAYRGLGVVIDEERKRNVVQTIFPRRHIRVSHYPSIHYTC